MINATVRASYEPPDTYSKLVFDMANQYDLVQLCFDRDGDDNVLAMYTGRSKTMSKAWHWLSKPMQRQGHWLHVDADSVSYAKLDLSEFDLAIPAVYGGRCNEHITVSTGAMLVTDSARQLLHDYLTAVRPSFPRYVTAKYDFTDLAEVDYVFCCMCIGLGISLVQTDQIAHRQSDVTEQTRLASNVNQPDGPYANA